MTFNRMEIINFKSKKRSYITWRKHLKPAQIKEAFYNGKKHLKDLFPQKNIEYCYSDMYDIVIGDYRVGLKYVEEGKTYYMFVAANSFYAYPQQIAVGKAVDGKIYFICENFPNFEYYMTFREIPEEYINKNERGFRPLSYNHSVFAIPSREHDISDEDVKCIKIAYEGVRAFSKLIEGITK